MDLKNGSEMLLKGGSLLGSSCGNCGGVQIKYKDQIYCMNCNHSSSSSTSDSHNTSNSNIKTNNDNVNSQKLHTNNIDIDFTEQKKIILEKINILIKSLQEDSDLLIQENKLDLIKSYFEVLHDLNITCK